MIVAKLRSPGRVAVLGLLLAGGLAATVSSSHAVYAAGSCTSSSVNAGSGGSVDISINTATGCDDSNGTASNPSTGYVQVSFPSTVSSAYAVFATQDLLGNNGQPYNEGNYSLKFTNCTGGSAVPDPINNYAVKNPTPAQIQQGTSLSNPYPTPPDDGTGIPYSITNAPFQFSANAAGGTVTCAYSVAVPGNPSTDIGVHSYVVDAFVFFTNQTQARTQSVKPPGACTTGCTFGGTQTPELGSGELFATGMLPILGIYLYRRRRRKDA